MKTNAPDELEKRRLDLQLDRELEDTFPASDALKITRRQVGRLETPARSGADEQRRAPDQDRNAASH